MKNTNIQEVKNNIGKNLFKARRTRKLTIQQASTFMGLKPNRLDWLERGQGSMNLTRLIKYCNFYQIEMKDLFK